jgi:gamma-glutamyltranspeptidase/glutathione hydrolase
MRLNHWIGQQCLRTCHTRLLQQTTALLLSALLALSAGAGAADKLALKHAAVAAAHPMAIQAGMDIMQRGGNAFDAAVAVSAALAVVEPYSSGIGGGGFFLLHRASDGFEVMIDAREKAPLAAHRDMYLDADGKPQAQLALEGAKAAAIPGLPAGLAWLAQRYGRLPLREALQPAIRLAQKGFEIDERFLAMATMKLPLLRKTPEIESIFLDSGQMPKPRYRLSQPELAQTLSTLGDEGHKGFYGGHVALRLVKSVRDYGGIWQMDDLAQYHVAERPPVRFEFDGLRITTVNLPSSGGATLAQAFNILAQLPWREADAAQRSHFVVEALRRAYHDRARYLGDSDFVSVPLGELISAGYAAQRARTIKEDRATPSADLSTALAQLNQGDHTTHFSVVDTQGNRVAGTLSINGPWGAGIVAGTSGVLLNNEMDDFSMSPGVPNLYGLVGSEANAIGPGKRPLSSMSPTFVEDERGVLILGTPGGSRIISMVLLAILDHAVNADPNPERSVSAARYHHQYLPDRIEIEPEGFDAAWVETLKSKGHEVHTVERKWGNMQAIFVDRRSGEARAANDPRGMGAWRQPGRQ